MKWEARATLIIGTLGWLVSLHVLNRIWQALAALFSWQFDGMLDRPTPFDKLTSPTPLFPLIMLTIWLQGALILYWLNQPDNPSSQNKTINSQSKGYVFWILIAIGLALALWIGWVERAGQLLPNASGQLPASNYDEMVYFSGSSLITQGYVPYRDFFLAHPPGAELLYAILLKLFGSVGGLGGYNDFLLARWGAIGLGLLTIGGATWVAGRIWAKAGFAWGPAIAAALLYAADTRAAGVATLETPANFFAIGTLGCYFEAERMKAGWWQRGLWLIGGILLAFSVLCKLPGAALVFALLVYLPVKKQWIELSWLTGGFIAGTLLVLGPFIVRAGPGEVLRQVVLFQLMRPQEVREGLDEIGRLADYPNSGLTIWLGGLALVLITAGLVRGRKEAGRWLVPVLWSLPLMVVFTLSKSFHPWYYVQWALPLAILGAGLFSTDLWYEIGGRWLAGRRRIVFTGVLCFALLLIGGPLLVAQLQEAGRPEVDRVYRPVGEALHAAGSDPVLVFDPGYSFMAGRLPARLPATSKFMVDSAGYMIYLNLDMDRRGFFDLLGAGLTGGRERGQVDALFRRDRAQAMVVEGLSGAGSVVLDGKLALPQLTPRSVEFIGTAAAKTTSIEYADLYQVRPLDLRRSWRFDNGLRLTPFGLSTSVDGRANADPVESGETIRLSSADAGRRNLDLRFVWRVDQTPTQPVKMFVHLIDEKGQTVAQRDSAPLDDKADTRQWHTGDAYQDVYSLPLPSSLSPGRYRVEIGIYNSITATRFSTEGKDSLTIGYIVIS